MSFPLGFWDISLWLAFSAAILLITSELLSPRYGKINILIDRGKLKNAALAISAIFLVTVTLRVISIIFAP